MASGVFQNLSMSSIQCLLFILYTVFLVVGIFLIALGSTAYAFYSEFEFFIESLYFYPLYLIITTGVFLILLSIFGCYVTFRKNTKLIYVYALLLTVLLLLDVGAAITAFNLKSTSYEDMQFNFFNTMGLYNSFAFARLAWHFIQKRLECCGVYNVQDWASKEVSGPEIILENNYTFTVPPSCCKNFDCRLFYKRGCLNRLEPYVSDSMMVVGGSATFVVIVQLFAVVITIQLVKAFRHIKTVQKTKRQETIQRILEETQEENNQAPCNTSPSTFA